MMSVALSKAALIISVSAAALCPPCLIIQVPLVPQGSGQVLLTRESPS